MSRSILSFAALILFVLATPNAVWGDAASDLADGRAALQAGDLDKAISLLNSAAEALPDSVEAQLALAECQLKLGQIDKALDQYRRALKLSPDHALAQRIVAALTGSDASFEKQLSSAKALMELGQYNSAAAVLKPIIARPLDPSQRAEAQLLLAESQLWLSGGSGSATNAPALSLALQLVEESDDAGIVHPARVIAVLLLLQQSPIDSAKIIELLDAAQELEQPWRGRADLARLLLILQDATKAAEVSAKLAAPLATIPRSEYRTSALNSVAGKLAVEARARMKHGDLDGAVAIVWPMIGSGAVPKMEIVL